MAAIAFEGLPRFTGYALVTKDYLDSRFNEFETRVEARLHRRLAEFAVGIDRRFIDIDKRFTEFETGSNQRFADFRLEMQREAGNLRGTLKLHSWMLALLMAGIFIPLVQRALA